MAKINDEFWSKRIQTVAENTLPSMYHQLKDTGRWDFVDLNWRKGLEPHIFWDSDIAKFLEAVCYAIKYTQPGDKYNIMYKEWIDEATKMIIKAQQPDGYLNTYFTQVKPNDRFKFVMNEHELYCCGHLLEAAVAHYEATGSLDLVHCLCRYLDYIDTVFGKEEGKLHGYPGHEEIELALVKLLDIVPEKKYYNLLDYFIEQRGYNNGEFYDEQLRQKGIDPNTYNPDGEYDHVPGLSGKVYPEPRWYQYSQADKQIRDRKEVTGHSVREMYYLTAVQALANMKKDESLKDSVYGLFRNMVDKKFYIHGGIGAISRWEGFGDDYDLRWDGYSETCASIGIVMLGQRMLQNKLDKEVALTMERALYNDVLGGVSIFGDSYFYNQPIEGKQGLTRQTWFHVSCCPPNVARIFNSLEKYSVSATDVNVAVHLYIGCEIANSNYSFKLSTEYPFSGSVSATIKSNAPVSFSIRAPETNYKVSNSDFVESEGYLIFSPRVWNETITMTFDTPVKIITPDVNVEANKGCLAVERGPFVYALENSGIEGDGVVDDIVISKDTKFTETKETFYNAEYVALTTNVKGVKCTFVPYFVTGNKNPGEDFRIWINEE